MAATSILLVFSTILSATTLNKETGRVDYDEMEKLALEHKPKLIIGGGSAYSREWDYARMRKIADEVGALR